MQKARERNVAAVLGGMAAVLSLAFSWAAHAAGVSGSQERAAREFMAAAASGSPQAVAQALHPDEVRRLRTEILARLREDAARGDPTARIRLFGEASNLEDLQRATDASFLALLLKRARYPARAFDRVDGLASVEDGKAVHVVVRGRQPPGRGKTPVVTLVTLLPYGKDWKAAVPSEIEAQLEDLLEAHAAQGLAARSREAPMSSGELPASNAPEILAMLSGAEKALVEARCEDFYGTYMSPGFRRVTSKKALETLIASCRRSESTRETTVAALRLARTLPPRYEYSGTRAVYDMTGRGLPFEQFVLERVDQRWYIAE